MRALFLTVILLLVGSCGGKTLADCEAQCSENGACVDTWRPEIEHCMCRHCQN